MTEIVHACLPGLSGVTPCCGKTPFELPPTDYMTVDPQAVTCKPIPAPTPGLMPCPTCGLTPTEPHPRRAGVDRCSNCKTHAPEQRAASVTEKIRPPWSAEQVAALNQFQREGRMHPFTCGGEHEQHVNLVAHPDGWRCPDPGCGYTQDWAPAFMADPDAWPDPFGHAERLRTGRAGGLDPAPIRRVPRLAGPTAVDLLRSPVTSDGPSKTAGFDDSIEMPEAPATDGLRDLYAAAIREWHGDWTKDTFAEAADAVIAVRDEELQRLRAETATADQIRADVQRDRDRLREELAASDETARRLLERHQELAAERYVWQERGLKAEATIDRMKRTNRMVNGGARDARERAEKAEATVERVRAECDRIEAAVRANPTHPDFDGAYLAALGHIRNALTLKDPS